MDAIVRAAWPQRGAQSTRTLHRVLCPISHEPLKLLDTCDFLRFLRVERVPFTDPASCASQQAASSATPRPEGSQRALDSRPNMTNREQRPAADRPITRVRGYEGTYRRTAAVPGYACDAPALDSEYGVAESETGRCFETSHRRSYAI